MDDTEIRNLDELENSHFWYKVRKDHLTSWFLKLNAKNLQILDLGSATGGNTLHILELGHNVTSVEYSSIGIDIQHKKGIPAIKADARNLPFANESFDVVICLDLLEHVLEDDIVVSEIVRVLVPEGRFLISVPQDPRLWSNHDISVNHLRRYTKQTLVNVVTKPEVVDTQLWSTIYLLKPVVILARKFTKGSSLKRIGYILNELLYLICKLELLLPKRYRAGVTLWVSGKKISKHQVGGSEI